MQLITDHSPVSLFIVSLSISKNPWGAHVEKHCCKLFTGLLNGWAPLMSKWGNRVYSVRVCNSHIGACNRLDRIIWAWVLTCSKIGMSSTRDCFDVIEYTNTNALPLTMESLTIAGKGWDPVVSVICSLHTLLLLFINWNRKTSLV